MRSPCSLAHLSESWIVKTSSLSGVVWDEWCVHGLAVSGRSPLGRRAHIHISEIVARRVTASNMARGESSSHEAVGNHMLWGLSPGWTALRLPVSAASEGWNWDAPAAAARAARAIALGEGARPGAAPPDSDDGTEGGGWGPSVGSDAGRVSLAVALCCPVTLTGSS